MEKNVKETFFPTGVMGAMNIPLGVLDTTAKYAQTSTSASTALTMGKHTSITLRG